MEISHYNLRQGKRSPQLVQRWEQKGCRFYLYCPETVLEVSVYADHLLRFRFSPEGFFEEDFSYAMASEGPMPEPDCPFQLEEVGDEFHLRTTELVCRISRTLHIRILDHEGHLISEDERGFHWEPHQVHGGNTVYCNKIIHEGESFFGLGDKPNYLNLRGMRFETWGSDMYGFERTTDPLYKNIPFFLGLVKGMGYGIFFDNSFRSRFDFGHERSDVLTFQANGGEMNYYFIYGPDLTRVVEGYHQLTGTPELPPLWALGYHQSKWSYSPESEVKALAERFRQEGIPCDVIHLDIEYMDEFRCFTWHPERFPDPKRLVAELEADGFKIVPILDPGIKIDRAYEVYQVGVEHGYFCRRADGPLMTGNVWPGPCHFPDFTHPEVRRWWGRLVEKFLAHGMHGIWNDMNEPAVLEVGTFPDDTRHFYDGQPCSHRKAHNVYGMQMARASYHGMKQAIYPRRPFALTRSGYAGVQRYAATWTGDNVSTWEHLWMASIQCQRLSVSGVSFVGSDVGGFIGGCNGELLTRWTQMAIFHPFFRNHSSNDHGEQEPWVYGEPYTSAIRQAIELRYQLLPYLYTTFWRHTQSGTPMLRPLSFIDQHDPQTHYRMDEFGLGPDLLICPILGPGEGGRRMYLPEGYWYHYWSDERHDGRKEFWVQAPLDQVPLFVKAGATVPHYPVMQYAGELVIDILDLHLYYDRGPVTSELYEDAGDYYEYEQGNYMVRTFTLQGEEKIARLTQRRKGRYNSDYAQLRFILHGWPYAVERIYLDDEPTGFEVKNGEGPRQFVVEVEKNFSELRIEG